MSTIEKALAKKNQNKITTNQPNTEHVKKQNKELPANSSVETNKDSKSNLLELDIATLNAKGYLIDNGQRKAIKDEFRTIKRKLFHNAFGKGAKLLNHPNLIMVSSPKPNEGKTFVSINLALSIALEQDKTVLLIDSDVLKPSLNTEFGIPKSKGLIEYLLGKEDVKNIIFNTNIDKLKLIPAGEPHHLSNELLASEKMASLAEELATRYPDRIVIFDCPPILGITETLVLANLMGQALIVAEESKTSISNLQKATSALNEELAVGIVLNKTIRSHKDLYGYYGYGYGREE